MTDDEEVTALCAQYADGWHVTRLPCGALDAAREPGRAYHVQAGDARELAECIARAEHRGSLV
jgi:hypothetical protein